MTGKGKGHRHNDLNPEAIFVVSAIIPSLQAFDPIVITSFFVVVVTAFSNMNSETQCFNPNLNGSKIAIPNG